MLGAASTLIREWAEKMLGLKFPNLSALARHLVDNFRVDTRSLAAVCILSASDQRDTSSNKGEQYLLNWFYKIYLFFISSN